MKNITKILIPFVALALWARADIPDMPEHSQGHHFEQETVTFLGVETGPASESLSAQLGLPDGTGLVVEQVVPDAPAAGVLRRNDLLTRLDDQILVEPRQFSVLIRNHKPGDEVALTLLRAGKEMTVHVKLALHSVPKMAGNFHELHGWPREMGPNPFERMMELNGAEPGVEVSTVDSNECSMSYKDDKGTLELNCDSGKKILTAKDLSGQTVFTGPVSTPEERKALSPELRERLERLEGEMKQDLGDKPAPDFKSGAPVPPPTPNHISAPLQETPRQKPVYL